MLPNKYVVQLFDGMQPTTAVIAAIFNIHWPAMNTDQIIKTDMHKTGVILNN